MVRMQPCVLTVLLLNVFISVVSSLYFHVEETEEKCFIEEIPEDTMLIGNFRTQLYDKQRDYYLPDNQYLGIFLEVKDPDDRLILRRQYGSEGRFTFTSRKPGRYQICMKSSPSQRPLPAGGMSTIHLDIRVGEHANNYTEIAAKENLTELQLRVWKLYEQYQHILKEHHYQRVRAEHYREISHNTGMWIFWWPVVRSLYVVAVIIWITNSW